MSSQSKNSPKIWFITGASLGFGRIMTEIVLKAGDIAIATVRRPGSLADLEASYSSDKLLVLQLDVTKEEEVTNAFARAKEVFGRIDVVYNNAGYAIAGEIEAVPITVARSLFDTNFWGNLSVTRAALAFFRENNRPMGGRLLQASSMLGLAASGAVGYYAASKFALEGMTEALVKELDPAWDIKVTLVEAGFFRTNAITDRRYEVYAHPAYTNPAVEGVAVRQMFRRDEPLQVTGDPEKLCKAMYKLAELDDPPLRLVIGQDALTTVTAKIAQLEEEKNKYKSWSDDLELNP